MRYWSSGEGWEEGCDREEKAIGGGDVMCPWVKGLRRGENRRSGVPEERDRLVSKAMWGLKPETIGRGAMLGIDLVTKPLRWEQKGQSFGVVQRGWEGIGGEDETKDDGDNDFSDVHDTHDLRESVEDE